MSAERSKPAVKADKLPDKKGERLQVVLARFGFASRRGVITMIEGGEVTVNGQVVREKGLRVDASKDKIAVNGTEIAAAHAPRKRTFMLCKPKGVMTTMQDPHAEHTVADFFKGVPERLVPVGRLDRDTTGLLLMTNDGDLAFRLTHPSFGITKRYRARVRGVVTEREVKQLEEGVTLEDGKTAPCRVELIEKTPKDTLLYVTLSEGKKRQVRRMLDHIRHTVMQLERVNFGPLALGEMKPGEIRELNPAELRLLREATGIKDGRQRKQA